MYNISEKVFRYKLHKGEEYEEIVCNLLLKSGYTIQPFYQFNNETTPYIYSNGDKYIAPDVTCFNVNENKFFYAEIKSKYQWVKGYGINSFELDDNDSYETGLNYYHFNQYIQIMNITNSELHIYFVHMNDEPLGVYRIIINPYNYQEVMENSRKSTIIEKRKKIQMIFFNYDNLEKIKSL